MQHWLIGPLLEKLLKYLWPCENSANLLSCTVITVRVSIAILLLSGLDSEEGWCVIFVISKKPKKPKQIVLYIIFSFYQSKDIYIYICIYINRNQSIVQGFWMKQMTGYNLDFEIRTGVANCQVPKSHPCAISPLSIIFTGLHHFVYNKQFV